MKSFVRHTAAFVCTAALAFGIVGCGQPANSGASDAGTQGTGEVTEERKRDATDATADGRIDVTTTGDRVATYHGPKYIVSDVTIDQKTGEEIKEGLGTQEICVVNQPESWESIGSIGWDRNSIRYDQIAMPWGTASITYSYVNEASGVEGIEEWSKTTEESFFNGFGDVQHVDVDGHTVGYAYEDVSSEENAMSIEEQAAALEGGESYTPAGHTVATYGYEQRGDKCALIVTVSGTVNDGAAVPSGEELIKLAYAPLQFAEKGASVNAASFVSDFTLTNADGSGSLVLARKDDSLISYTEHTAALLGATQSDENIALTTYDFAPAEAAPEDAEQYEIEGRTVLAKRGEDDGMLYAWTDVDGNTLYLSSSILDDDVVEEVLNRVLAGRIVS